MSDARLLLGVEPLADREVVRRAYLRLLKVYKPESDPAGFQRLREAYDLLRSTPVGMGGTPFEGVGFSPTATWRLPLPGGGSVEVEPGPPDDLSEPAERLEPTEPVALPEPPGLEATDEALMAWLDIGPEDAWISLAWRFMDRQRVDLAVDVIFVALGRAGVPPYSLDAKALVSLLLELAGLGHRATVRRLWAAVEAGLGDADDLWIADVGDEPWELFLAVASLPGRFPDEVFGALAVAARRNQARAALPALQTFAERRPELGRDLYGHLFEVAPATHGKAIQEGGSRSTAARDKASSENRFSGWRWWTWLLGLYLLLRSICRLAE